MTNLPVFRHKERQRMLMTRSWPQRFLIPSALSLCVLPTLYGLRHMTANKYMTRESTLLAALPYAWCLITGFWGWMWTYSMAERWKHAHGIYHAAFRLLATMIVWLLIVMYLQALDRDPAAIWIAAGLITAVANFTTLSKDMDHGTMSDRQVSARIARAMRAKRWFVPYLVTPLLVISVVTLYSVQHGIEHLQYVGHQRLPVMSNAKLDTKLGAYTGIVLIFSSWTHQSALWRDTARKTTLKLLPPGFEARFVLGEAPSAYTQYNLGPHIIQESQIYSDILVVPAADHRRSQKFLQALRALQNTDYHYLIKTDDNVFVRYDVLGDELAELETQQGIWKGLTYYHIPSDFDWSGIDQSRAKHTHDTDMDQAYDLLILPPFVSGTLIILSKDVVDLALVGDGIYRHLDHEDHSLALWLHGSTLKPMHDARVQDLAVCEDNLIATRVNKKEDMEILVDNVLHQRPLCSSMDTSHCAMCYSCFGDKDDYRRLNVQCNDYGVSPISLPFQRIPSTGIRDPLPTFVVGTNDSWILDNVLSTRTSIYTNTNDWSLIYWVCWTSDISTFRERHWQALDLVWTHQPRAEIFMISNTLPENMFDLYTARGYRIHVIRFSKENLLAWRWYFGPGTRDWLQNWEAWEKYPYFYWHLTDYLRCVLLYHYGGTYMDMDVLWLREPPDPDMEFIGSDVTSLESDRSWTLNERGLYLPQGVMRFKRGLKLFREMAESTFSAFTYDPHCFNCGGPKAITTYVKHQMEPLVAQGFTILPEPVLYPISYLDIHRWFLHDPQAETKLIGSILPHSWNIHLFGKMTNRIDIAKGSIVDFVLQRFDLALPRASTQQPPPPRLMGPTRLVYRPVSEDMAIAPRAGYFQGAEVIFIRGGPEMYHQVDLNIKCQSGTISVDPSKKVTQQLHMALTSVTQCELNTLFHSLVYQPSSDTLTQGGWDHITITLTLDDRLPPLSHQITVMIAVSDTSTNDPSDV